MEDEFYEERREESYEEEEAYSVDDDEDEMAGFYAGYNKAYEEDWKKINYKTKNSIYFL